MTIYIITIFISSLIILIIRVVMRNRKKDESKLSVFEHPSNFKKPPIEMVNSVSVKKSKDNKNQIEFKDHIKNEDSL